MTYNFIMNAKILVVDDEIDLLDLLEMNLSSEGFTVIKAQTAQQAVNAIRDDRPDIILLDIMLGETSGIDLTAKLKNLHETASIPIIMLTAKDTDTDMVVGLKVGADDYITKPFSTQVLVARIEAVLRRIPKEIYTEDSIVVGPLRIIPNAMQVKVKDRDVDLTACEYDILMALITARGGLLTRTELIDAIQDNLQSQRDRIVDVHVASLRKKLGPEGRNIVKTVHNKGYRINS